MMTLDIFRASVAAAALGFARRALDEALGRAVSRPMFGQRLADLQLTQAALGDMATEIDAAALLTYRAAWLRDVKKVRRSEEHTSELQSLMRISYAVFFLKKKHMSHFTLLFYLSILF